MSFSSSESSDGGEDSGDQQMKFVLILKENKILFSKSQLPAVKREKEIAVQKVVQLYNELFKENATAKQMFKKISNMKTTVKKKFDLNVTGNKKIVYKPWEKCFLDILNCQSNPTFNKIPGNYFFFFL